MKHKYIILLFFLISLVTLKSLLHPGLYTSHDIWHNLARLIYYNRAISDGQFPPYFINTLANGFGYPLFLFSYHLPWLLGVIFLKTGYSPDTVLKILFFISYFFSGLAMYFFTLDIFKSKLSAFLSAFLYLWAPYRFLIIYVSAATGVAFSFIFIPFIFWGLHLSDKKNIKSIILLAIGMAGIVLSHLPSLVVLIPTIIIFATYKYFTGNKFLIITKNIIAGTFVGFLIAAFYLLPAAFYNPSIQGLPQIYQNGFLTLKQIIYSKWGYGIISTNAQNTDLSFQLGIAQWLVILLSLGSLVIFKKKRKFIIFLLSAFVVNLLLMLKISSPFWKLFSHLVSVDQPFRFLLPSLFIASFLSGFIISSLPGKFKIITLSLLMIIAIYTNRNHLNVNMYIYPQYDNLLSGEITTSTYNEYLPKDANTGLVNVKKDSIISGGVINNLKVEEDSTKSIINFTLPTNQQITFNKYYYPFLTASIDGTFAQIEKDNSGLTKLPIPNGDHQVIIGFKKPFIINLGMFLSFIGVITFFAITLGNLKKKFVKLMYT